MSKLKKILLIIIPAVALIVVVLFACGVFKEKNVLVSTGRTFKHNENSFTQGLFFDEDGTMYETGGMYGKSAIYKGVDLASGIYEKAVKAEPTDFYEGSTIFNDKIFVLTWKERVIYQYDKQLNLVKTFDYDREGWGLTHDDKNLIASDGSSSLFFLDEDMKTVKTIDVVEDNKPVEQLNELEYINGLVYANVWQTDKIVAINPENGLVVKSYDFSDLFPKDKRTGKTDVLNGIAYNKKTNKIYLTGKYWPKFYEFELAQ